MSLMLRVGKRLGEVPAAPKGQCDQSLIRLVPENYVLTFTAVVVTLHFMSTLSNPDVHIPSRI